MGGKQRTRGARRRNGKSECMHNCTERKGGEERRGMEMRGRGREEREGCEAEQRRRRHKYI